MKITKADWDRAVHVSELTDEQREGLELLTRMHSGQTGRFPIIKSEAGIPGTVRAAMSSFYRKLSKAEIVAKGGSGPRTDSGNYQPAGTRGEEEAARAGDGAGAKNEAVRTANNQVRQWESEQRTAEYEADQILAGEKPLTAAERARLAELDRYINVRRALLAGAGIAKSDDALDWMAQQRAAATASATVLQSTQISKADQALDADLAAEAMGIRRSRSVELSKREKELADLDLSDPFGIRNKRLLRR